MKLQQETHPNFKEYLNNLGLSDLTKTRYLNYLRMFTGLYEGFLNQGTIDSFLQKKDTPTPRSMIKHLLTYLKRTEGFTIEEQLEISKLNILKKTGHSEKKEIQIIKRALVSKLVNETILKNNFETRIFQLMASFQFSGALRITELSLLEFRDLNIKFINQDLKNHKIKIRSEIAKNKKSGTVYIKTSLINSYLKLLEIIEKINPEIHNKIKNNIVTIWNDTTREKYSKHFRIQSKKILDKSLHTHCLRHSRATDLIESGMTLKETQKFMRHDRAETTLIYWNLVNDDIGESLEAIS